MGQICLQIFGISFYAERAYDMQCEKLFSCVIFSAEYHRVEKNAIALLNISLFRVELWGIERKTVSGVWAETSACFWRVTSDCLHVHENKLQHDGDDMEYSKFVSNYVNLLCLL